MAGGREALLQAETKAPSQPTKRAETIQNFLRRSTQSTCSRLLVSFGGGIGFGGGVSGFIDLILKHIPMNQDELNGSQARLTIPPNKMLNGFIYVKHSKWNTLE
jgi:hypothetical protein